MQQSRESHERARQRGAGERACCPTGGAFPEAAWIRVGRLWQISTLGLLGWESCRTFVPDINVEASAT